MAVRRLTKRVFLSSTVYDLRKERALVRKVIESYSGADGLRFEVMASDHADFPIGPSERATKHSYELCIEAVAKADYFVLLLNKRYGSPVIDDSSGPISITHREFREAVFRRIPRFVLVDRLTWDAKLTHSKGIAQTHVSSKDQPLFDFIDEIRHRTKGNWIDFYDDLTDIETIISTFLNRYDDTAFIADVTIPNGHQIRGGTHFLKTWEIENTGLQIWKGRILREENKGASGLAADKSEVPIPKTRPGQRVQISVGFTAPEQPATCESVWKMVGADGELSFPHKLGLECRVKVV